LSGKEIVTIAGQETKSNKPRVLSNCNQEEADTRLVIHVVDGLNNGATTCLVRTVDTDVIVILLGKFQLFRYICPNIKLWVEFGVGKRYSYINLNEIANGLGKEKCEVLPAFHSFTGSDTTLSFFGKGKKTAFEAWKWFPDVTSAFRILTSLPFTPVNINSEYFSILERYTVVMYDKTSSDKKVNEARKNKKKVFVKTDVPLRYMSK